MVLPVVLLILQEEINKSIDHKTSDIWINIESPGHQKGRPLVGGLSYPAQSISGCLEKLLTPFVSYLKADVKDD